MGGSAGGQNSEQDEATETTINFVLGQMNRLSKGDAASLKLLEIVFGIRRPGGGQGRFRFMISGMMRGGFVVVSVVLFHRNIAVAAVAAAMAPFTDMVGAGVLGAVHTDVARDVAAD